MQKVDKLVNILTDPIGFFAALLTLAAVAFLRAFSSGATLIKSLSLAAVTFVLCGSVGAILIFQFGLHPFASCGICGLFSLVSERVLKSLERLVGVAEKRVAHEIEDRPIDPDEPDDDEIFKKKNA